MNAYEQPIRSIRLLAGLRLRRLLNMYLSSTRRFSRSGAAAHVDRKQALVRACIAGLVMALVMTSVVYTFGHGVDHILSVLCRHGYAQCRGATFDQGMLQGMTMLMWLSWLVIAIFPFTLSLNSGPGWDFEWMATLPMPRAILLSARIIERGLVNPLGWVAFLTLGIVVALRAGASWFAPLYAIAVAMPLLLTASALWVVLDIGLRIALPPNSMRNLQALLSVAMAPLMFLFAYLRSPSGESAALILTAHTPGWAAWTAPGLAIQVVSAPFEKQTLGIFGLLVGQSALVVLLSVSFLRFQLRDGLVSHGERESGRGSRTTASLPIWNRNPGRFGLSPVKWREAVLLLRDRRYFVQLLCLPFLMIAAQFFVNRHLADKLAQSITALPVAAFCMAAYMLNQSALQMLPTERRTLWLLYTFPRPIQNVLWEKGQFYLALALPYPVMFCAFCLARSHGGWWHFAPGLGFALAGLPVFSAIAIALGILSGVDQRWSKALYGYLFLILVGVYAYALSTGNWLQEAPTLALSAALGFALWQKACDQLPYLLDPSSAPAPAVALADGLIAALMFFAFHMIAIIVLRHQAHLDWLAATILGYVCAGAMTYALVRGAFHALKTRNVPKILDRNVFKSISEGVGGGLLCASIGLAYLWTIRHYHWLPVVAGPRHLTMAARGAITLLCVFAAPIFEEFIFRGLIFAGMRRSLNLPLAALGSAVLFAIVHPLYSFFPVFVVGLVTAHLYERRRTLLPSMVTHGLYNAVVVGYQIFVLST